MIPNPAYLRTIQSYVLYIYDTMHDGFQKVIRTPW
jgi:hypothetical protein